MAALGYWPVPLYNACSDMLELVHTGEEAGIPLWFKDVASPGPFEKLSVTKPWNFKMAWYRALALAGLRRSSAGGFGAIIPEPSSFGGFG